jgi:YdjC-like protein
MIWLSVERYAEPARRLLLRSLRIRPARLPDLMVNWPSAAAAAQYARRTPALSVGLHLDLGEWVFRNGEWTSLYQVVRSDDPSAIEQEIVRQLERFQRLMGCEPTHIDSHQHVHRHDCGVTRLGCTSASARPKHACSAMPDCVPPSSRKASN